jgi:glutamyl-tRNA synthetase/nondiscriminating glutamyl-tRNA synthetase
MEKLYWLNRHYLKGKSAAEIYNACVGFLFRSGELSREGEVGGSLMLPPGFREWFLKVIELLAPSVDRLEQFPDRTSLIFRYDAQGAITSPNNEEVLRLPNTGTVITRFTVKVLEDESARNGELTPETFKRLVNEVKAETGAKGKELFHPIRIIITGSHSGPEFDKLVPILEEGSHLELPRHVLSVRERVEACGSVYTQKH